MRSHLEVVEVLLESGGPMLLLNKDILGCTPVHLAAVQNQVRPLVTHHCSNGSMSSSRGAFAGPEVITLLTEC